MQAAALALFKAAALRLLCFIPGRYSRKDLIYIKIVFMRPQITGNLHQNMPPLPAEIFNG